jgi:hypothetical protein
MKVHWSHKWLSIPYCGTQVTLQGMIPGVLDFNFVELLYFIFSFRF